MTSEIDTFRAELSAAGQPWSRRGIWITGAGILLMAAAQVVQLASLFFPILMFSLALITVGWMCLIVGVVRRRRWAKAHPMVMPGLADIEHGASENP